jgi:hypothetical protein
MTHLKSKLLFVEREIVIEDLKLLVLCSILVKQQLGKEGKVLCRPHVVRIAGTERNSVPSEPSTRILMT